MKQRGFFFDQTKPDISFKVAFCTFCLSGVVLMMMGCGEEIGGSGQCGGGKDSGVCLTIDSISPKDTVAGGGTTSDIDAVQTADCDGDPSTTDSELFGAHSADVSFSLLKTSPTVTVPPATAFITLTQYTITYTLDPNSPAGPALTSRTFNETIRIDTGASVTETLRFVEVAQKLEYLNGVGATGANPPRSYTATYTFTGTDQYNSPVSVRGVVQFSIGNFDRCS